MLFVTSMENLKTPKYGTPLKKHQFFLLYAVSAGMKTKKYLKKKNQLRY